MTTMTHINKKVIDKSKLQGYTKYSCGHKRRLKGNFSRELSRPCKKCRTVVLEERARHRMALPYYLKED